MSTALRDVADNSSMATFKAEVEDYDASDLVELAGGPDWTPDPTRVAILVHDMQPYYLDVLAAQVRSRLLSEVSALLKRAVDLGVPILGSGPRPATEPAQRGLLGSMWGLGPDPRQAEETALDELVSPDVVWVKKRSYSAFFATDLAEELRRRGRDQLIVAGVFATAGVLATSYDAFARDIQCFVGVESTADYTKRQHAAALTLISALTGRVQPTASLLS